MKRCMLLLMGAGLTYGASAQLRQHISFGPSVGFGHSWLSTSDPIASGYKNAFHSAYNVGVKMVYSIDPHWGVSIDTRFSSEGGHLENKNPGGGVDETELVYRSNYIRVPLQGIYFFGDYGDRVRPKVSIGPSFGFMVGGEVKVKNDDEKVVDEDIKDNFKTFDVGATGAIGANIRVARNTWLNTDLAYYHGFSDINDVNASNNKIKNRNLGVNVGLMFGIGR